MNNTELKVSGYRGVWGENLNENIVKTYVKAFCDFTKEDTKKENPTILIGRDGRESGQTIAKITISVLEKLGVKFIYGDILSTPTVMFAVNKYKYDGAIIITASHNPKKYNGLKFVTKDARMTNEEEVEKIKKHLTSQTSLQEHIASESLAQADEPSRAIFQQENMCADGSNMSSKFACEHADFILKNIDADIIRAKKFKVAVDMINAAACTIDPYLFEQLGIEYVAINDTPDGNFGHTPEPLKENLYDLEKLVKEHNCDIGFAQDPDADRLVVVDNNGEVVREDYTLAFGVENVLSKNSEQTVVINMSTSQMIADIAKKYNSKCLLTKVGESNVFAGMKKENAIIGGEGGGGVIYPKMNNCRDSFVSMTLTLSLLAERNQTVTELVDSLPKYFMKKDKENIEGKNLAEMYKKLKNHFTNTEINEEDGLRLVFQDQSWLHLRPSNTEPIIRLSGEAKISERVEELFKEAKEVIS